MGRVGWGEPLTVTGRAPPADPPELGVLSSRRLVGLGGLTASVPPGEGGVMSALGGAAVRGMALFPCFSERF